MGSNFIGGGALLLAGGLFFMYRAADTARDGIMSYTWESTTGIVETAQLRTIQRTDKPDQIIGDLKYSYQVNGTIYRNDRYSFFSISGDEVSGVNKLEVGQQVTVHYDPADPERAVIERELPGFFVWAGFLFGMVLFMLGISLTFFGDVGAIFSKMTGN